MSEANPSTPFEQYLRDDITATGAVAYTSPEELQGEIRRRAQDLDAAALDGLQEDMGYLRYEHETGEPILDRSTMSLEDREEADKSDRLVRKGTTSKDAHERSKLQELRATIKSLGAFARRATNGTSAAAAGLVAAYGAEALLEADSPNAWTATAAFVGGVMGARVARKTIGPRAERYGAHLNARRKMAKDAH